MSSLRTCLLALAAAVLAACGGPAETNTAPEAAAPPAQSQAESSPAPAPVAAEPAPATPAPAVVQESADSAAGEGGQSLVLATAAAAPATPTEWRFKPGQDYVVLASAQGTSSSPDKIEIAEVFWYGCPHCYNLEPQIRNWEKKLAPDVSFVRLPVMWNPTNQIHARLFYTAQALNKLSDMNEAIFREIHVNKKMLADEAEIQAFFERFGVGAADFQKTFRSFAVEGQLRRAKELTQRYQVRSVPQMVVNGKYTTDAPGVKSFDDMLAVVSELVERERQRL
jgi:protein dithiol oxidoreductase (disulfide-forming)